MALIPWRPLRELDLWRPLWDAETEVPRFMEQFLGRRPLPAITEGLWAPLLDIQDKKDKYIIKAEISEIDPKNVDISAEGHTLTIKGDRKLDEETKKEDYYLCERCYGSFQRTVTLPAEVDATKAKASYKDGVLTITLPKSMEKAAKQIKVDVK